MEQNIFEEYQTEKKRLIKIAAQARANNWINEKQEQEIIEKSTIPPSLWALSDK